MAAIDLYVDHNRDLLWETLHDSPKWYRTYVLTLIAKQIKKNTEETGSCGIQNCYACIGKVKMQEAHKRYMVRKRAKKRLLQQTLEPTQGT